MFLGKELLPSNGVYTSPKYDNQTGCIGLEWIERRRIQQLAVDFAATAPPSDGVRVQYWVMANAGVTKGGSTWQGRWENLPGKLTVNGNSWIYDDDWKGNPNKGGGTLKIRWIIPRFDRERHPARASCVFRLTLADYRSDHSSGQTSFRQASRDRSL